LAKRSIWLLLLLPLLILDGCGRDEGHAGKTASQIAEGQALVKPAERNLAGPAGLDLQPRKGPARESRDQQSGNSLKKVNSPPKVVATAFADPAIHRGVDIEIVTDTEDAEGDQVSLLFRWFVNGKELLEQNQAVLPGDKFRKGDRIAVWIVPFDQTGQGKIFYGAEFSIPNALPTFISAPPNAFKTKEFTYSPKVLDPDGDQLTFALDSGPPGMTIAPVTGELRWPIDPATRGEQQVRIAVTDTDGATAVQEFILNLSN